MRARDTVTRVLEPCNAFVHATRLRALDDAARAAFAGLPGQSVGCGIKELRRQAYDAIALQLNAA